MYEFQRNDVEKTIYKIKEERNSQQTKHNTTIQKRTKRTGVLRVQYLPRHSTIQSSP